MNKLKALVVMVFLLVGSEAYAQAVPGDRLAWDQAAPSLAAAQGYRYKLAVDTATIGTTVTATCTGTASPFMCVAALPALTTGAHSVRVQTFLVTSTGADGGASPLSAVFNFTLSALPAAPVNLRIVAGE
jgi:predicted naringenin-chalcone synthase